MTEFLYTFISKVVKMFSSYDIVAKPLKGFDKQLYYERSQHLTFLFKSKIAYEQTVWNHISKYVTAGVNVFDIGGNIGQYALRFSEKVGEGGKIYSFEPDFKNYAFLQFNVNINRCKNVICINQGLGKEHGEIEFFRDTETGGRMGSFIKEFVQDKFKGHSDIVKVETFANLTEKYGVPDFVKIDVEGFELQVLEGILNFQTDTIYLVEVREETKKDVFQMFSKEGFDCFVIDNPEKVKIESGDKIPSFANLLFMKNKAN